MLAPPYIGITGVKTADEAEALAGMARRLGMPQPYVLMRGVLASYKGLAFGQAQDIQQYPSLSALSDALPPAERTLDLIHYNSRAAGLARQLEEILRLTPGAEGVQLNIAWPDPAELERFRRHRYAYVVLQVGVEASARFDSNKRLVAALQGYGGLVDYVLIDPSGGHGEAFDADFAAETLDSLTCADLSMRFGIAGGLDGANVSDKIRPLQQMYPNLSWDAQGKLRSDDGESLDLEACEAYLSASFAIVR